MLPELFVTSDIFHFINVHPSSVDNSLIISVAVR